MQIKLRARRRVPARPTRYSSVFGVTRAPARLRSRRCSPLCTGKRVSSLVPAALVLIKSYYQQIIDRVTSDLADDAELVGWAMCRADGSRGQPALRGHAGEIRRRPLSSLLEQLGCRKRITPPRKIWTTWLQPPKAVLGG